MLPVLKIQNFFDLQNDLAEIRLYAERKAGELLKETELNKGAATASSDMTALPKLKDIGITRNQSSNWQRVSEVPTEGNVVPIRSQYRYSDV